MEQILIGRRTVDKDTFIAAVKQSNSVRATCELLGFNKTVGSTRNAIQEQIDNLKLDTTHFKPCMYSKEYLEKVAITSVKAFTLSKDNQQYYDSFKQTITPKSWLTYKASVGNFLEFLKDKDFATTSDIEIMNYVGERYNAKAHIRSMMIYVVSNNINNAKEKISKDMLIWLISK